MSNDNNKDKIKKVITTRTPKEEEILRKKFNIESDKQKAFDEVGKDFNITRKRIQEIEKKALKKIKENLPDDVA